MNDMKMTRKVLEVEKSKPFFSIIIPVYNVAPYLRECLDSVLAQTYPNWECLCVNDGSTDGSSAILDEYAEKDSRFRVFHKTNGGVSAARNISLQARFMGRPSPQSSKSHSYPCVNNLRI